VARPVKHYGRWRIRWLDARGERRSEVFEKHRDAELALQRHEVEAEEIRRGLRPAPLESRTFGELADYWLEHRASRKRSEKDDQSIIRRHLRPAFGALPLVEVDVVRIDALITSIGGKKTLHNILTLLISMLNLAVELNWLVKRPRVRKPRIALVSHDFRYLRTKEEIDKFLRAAREADELLFVLYAAAVYTGMRAGELAGLQWDDIDLGKRLITVQRSFDGPTKVDEVRYVPILDPLLPVLREWRLRCPGVLVFPNEAGRMHKPSARIFQERFHKVLVKAGFAEEMRNGKRRTYITFHGTRHTFASHWMMNGGDIFRLQRIGGWKSFAMVQRYAHLAPEAFSQDYERLGKHVPTELPATVIPFPSGSAN
jgi:integrase